MSNFIRKKLIFLSLFLIFGLVNVCIAYNGSNAVSYANTWWDTDTENNGVGDGFVDRVNVNDGYTWYYNGGTNDGDNTVSVDLGVDCANFVSQRLIAGGLTLNGNG